MAGIPAGRPAKGVVAMDQKGLIRAVKEQNVDIEDGRIVAWKVDLLVTFVLE